MRGLFVQRQNRCLPKKVVAVNLNGIYIRSVKDKMK